MAKMGRPIKLTPELQTQIVNFIKLGNYVETAAAAAGIHKSTLYDWLRKGARYLQDDVPENADVSEWALYADFSNAVNKALAEAEVRDVTIITKAAQESWQAAAWKLERRAPDRWGRKEKASLELSGKDGGPIEHTVSAREELARRINSIIRRTGEGGGSEGDN